MESKYRIGMYSTPAQSRPLPKTQPMTNQEAGRLVLIADRSTQTNCPDNTPAKGLIKTGDRVYINDNYIAWFDLSTNDGVAFTTPPPFFEAKLILPAASGIR
ncbi:MAG: hypothetical protein ABL958_16390 [Bdellovibrionia bacterium]